MCTRSYFPYMLYFVSLFGLFGCITNTAGPAGSHAPDLPARYSLPEVSSSMPAPPEGTIYGSGSSFDIYADSRAKHVGDIVLVRIVENSSGKKEAITDIERDSTFRGGIASFFGFEKWLADRNSNFTPSNSEISASLSSVLDAEAETERNDNMTATLSARVIDKTLDGNLVIRGYREVRVNNETQFIILSGLVRPEDIGQDNSVLSSHIADARIEYNGIGVLSDKQQPGWLARALDVVWPF